MLNVFYLVESQDEDLRSQNFINTYGVIINDINISTISIHFYPFFLLRRLVYALILIIFYDHVVIQFVFLIVITILPVYFLRDLDAGIFNSY